ncbi:MAG: serine/threonine-protein kinase [Pirellulaceae bacterium]
MDSTLPTMIFEAPRSGMGPMSRDVSRAHIGFVAGDRPQFSEETAGILRNRLAAAALVIAVVMGAAFLGNVLAGVVTLWWLRALIVLVTAVAAVLLRSRRNLSLRTLRLMELIVFGSVLVQLSVMLLVRLTEFTAQHDAVSLAAARQQYLMAWCLLIFIYGTLLPNTWKRGAAIMISAALIPYVLIVLHGWFSPTTAELWSADHANSPLPLPLVAALIATYASHIINTARREAFKARQFGQYRLMQRLGAGGMGEVYQAEHLLLKRPCAIKLIRAACDADAAALARFEKEVQVTARLTHWNSVEIYDYGRTDDGTFYYVMELLPGMSLEDIVQRHGPLPPERVVHLVTQICGALQEAHLAGVIHRDIKPANIFASQRGGIRDVAKLLDFGLVKAGQERSEAGEGAFSGTPSYMSPEQASAYDDVDGRADIYSLGAVAYYLLTGRTPFTSQNVLELLAAHRLAEIVPPSRWNAAIGTDLDQVIVKCLAKRPADRYPDANALRQALDQCAAATGWGPEQAAAWWQAIDKQPTRRTAGSAPTQANVDATMDYRAN